METFETTKGKNRDVILIAYDQPCHHRETSQLIYKANHWSGSYIMRIVLIWFT